MDFLGETCRSKNGKHEQYNHSVHPPPPHFLQGVIELPVKFSKRGGLAGPQLLEGGCWERGGDFFLQFSHKNKTRNI